MTRKICKNFFLTFPAIVYNKNYSSRHTVWQHLDINVMNKAIQFATSVGTICGSGDGNNRITSCYIAATLKCHCWILFGFVTLFLCEKFWINEKQRLYWIVSIWKVCGQSFTMYCIYFKFIIIGRRLNG